ncbi:putative xenotropic and polytropic murine leukemia virus receptor pho1 [Corchorus olitorius]|uniref:Xenotropic and polytropic murine leukemia virus receptor pho1 n=1 Tax=Corchorus olitorius TaxID=93759 RepID=A0A1R3KK63_9ROSI|nr:putative xenotropic and polytropic murine leukemia virus receptor pho1 [Corchorus olitorius]
MGASGKASLRGLEVVARKTEVRLGLKGQQRSSLEVLDVVGVGKRLRYDGATVRRFLVEFRRTTAGSE